MIGDEVLAKDDMIISSFGVAVRSDVLGLATEPAWSADGDALGVGVEVTDNFDPPLWCPEDEDGVCDLTGEYCCSNPTPPREDLSLFLFDDGGLGGRPPPIPTVLGDSSSSKCTECGELDELIPVVHISSSTVSSIEKSEEEFYWIFVTHCCLKQLGVLNTK